MGSEVPDDFRCPISLDLMSDPVIISSGHTFDRASIQRWIDSGHLTCPITKLPLTNPPSLIPNHALRSLISNFAPRFSNCYSSGPNCDTLGPGLDRRGSVSDSVSGFGSCYDSARNPETLVPDFENGYSSTTNTRSLTRGLDRRGLVSDSVSGFGSCYDSAQNPQTLVPDFENGYNSTANSQALARGLDRRGLIPEFASGFGNGYGSAQNPQTVAPDFDRRGLISDFASGFDHNYGSGQNPQTLAPNLNRRRVAESGAVLRLVSSSDPRLKEKALNLLLNLSLDDDNKIGLVAEGVICHVIDVLRGGGDGPRAVAATIVTSLAVVEVNKATIGAYPFAIGALISLLSGGNGRERKEAATALYTLCSYPENRRRCVDFGGVPVLINAARMGLERAVEVLGLLAKCKEGRSEMGKDSTFLSVLVDFLKNGSPRGVQYALATMGSLCMYSEGLRGDILGEGVFEYCVGLLEDESEKVRRNASNLIQILRGKKAMS